MNSEKPDECIICYEKLEETSPLQCGHWLHVSCVEKHFKPECPICRAPLQIEVKGTFPQPFIPFNFIEPEPRIIIDTIQYIHDNIDNYHIDEDTGAIYYLSPEQSEDEENPFGDDYDYPDEEEE
jgi:hypothetical protein